ncbi:hypothetical protein [Psychromicrobium lacuslunae]|uniref:Uncharacterized protein n=1 Tax=Psychromicrobium lacuslunae TaxID=1618207 RepID=A0A0D4BXQ4_9MICC|nr:hypothetical protein [Psychromicrobium lacuslunae]AJT41093.1 hypothetical protein UM93_05400 [Psychromicrobium lacuslunae]
MGTFSESISVQNGPGCRPVKLSWRGENYQVVAGRRRPFVLSGYLKAAGGVGSAEYELWELEVTHPERSRRTMSVTHRVGGENWRLIRLTEQSRRSFGSLAAL